MILAVVVIVVLLIVCIGSIMLNVVLFGKRDPHDQSLLDNLTNFRNNAKGKEVPLLVDVAAMIEDGWNPATKKRVTELLGDLMDDLTSAKRLAAPLFEGYAKELLSNDSTRSVVERALEHQGYQLTKKTAPKSEE